MQTKLEKSTPIKLMLPKDLLSKISVLILVVIAAFVVLQAYFFIHDRDAAENNAKAHGKQEVDRVIGELDVKFKKLMSITQSFSDELSTGKISNAMLQESLKQVMEANPQVYAFGVAYEPYAYESGTEKYARYYARKKEGLELIKLDEIEDYLGTNPNWYHFERDNGPVWVEPYYMPEVDVSIVEFGVPFYRTVDGKKAKAGVVYIDYSISDVKEIMTSLDLGKTGYGYILTQKGKYVAHPVDEYVKGEKSIFNVAKELGNKNLEQIGKSITTEGSGLKEFENELNGQDSWVIYKTIPSTGWSMVVTFIKGWSNADIIKQRQQLILCALGIALFLILLCIVIFTELKGHERRWWLAVFCSSIVLILCLGSIWYFALAYTPYLDEKQDIIVDKAGLNRFEDSQLKLAKTNHEETPVFVPTGVFVSSMEILNATDVRLNGYIWQKYYAGVHDNLKRSFALPGMISGNISEIYRNKDDKAETIRWSFNVVLRQHFEYTRYPLESSGIYLRLLQGDFDRNVILVPDLDSYSITNPSSLPGIERDHPLPGWSTGSSYFTYLKDSTGTSMGAGSHLGNNGLPELCFTIIVNKEFIAPFITDLLPIFVILCALFAVLLMVTKDEKKAGIFGLKTSGVIGTSSGLLFSVIISHTRLRSELPVKEIIYLENFYLLLYFVIILVAVNSFIFTASNSIRILHFKDNLIPKLLYWPVIFVVLIGITLKIFY